MNQEVTIRLEYGSDFQKDVWSGSLEIMLGALKAQMESRHKKNKLNYETK